MTRQAEKTGPGAMALVAIEQAFAESERITHDELAYGILPWDSQVWVSLLRPFRNWLVTRTEQKMPGLWGSIMARKAYFDDVVAATDAEAVVNLGAGFDTRSYRLPELASTPIWEVDQPACIEAKRRRLLSILGEVPANVTLVPIDFDTQNLGETLGSFGYSDDRRTLFIWEGVTQYVTEAGIRATLALTAKAPAGSRLVFTYVPLAFIEGRHLLGHDHLYSKMRGNPPVWVFGIEPEGVGAFIGEYGWQTVEHVGYDDLVNRYIRPSGRDLGTMAIERIVVAEKRQDEEQ
jgi:methyltransferase (TIGR00027 family)